MPDPIARDVEAHSPTPSMVRTAASLKGDGKKAEAAWLRWCSEKKSFDFQSTLLPKAILKKLVIVVFWNSLSLSQSGSDVAKLLKPFGAKAREVSKSRSNLRNGLS